MLATNINLTTEESKLITCMSGIGNLGRKRVEWRRNANVEINHLSNNKCLGQL